jgi:hypothetical protein
MQIKKYSKNIITAAVWLLFFLNLYIVNGTLLSSLEKNNLIWYDSTCFVNTGNMGVSIFRYIHSFIMQFAYYPLLGTIVILLLCLLFVYICQRPLKKMPFSYWWALLFIAGWQITFPYFGLYFLLVGIIIASTVFLLSRIRNLLVRYVVLIFCAAVLFIALKDTMHYVFYLNNRFLPQPIHFFEIVGMRKIVCIVGFLLMFIPVITGIMGAIPGTAKLLSSKINIFILSVFFLMGASTTLYVDHSQKTILKLERILSNKIDETITLVRWEEAEASISDFYDKYAEKAIVGEKEKEILSGYATVSLLMSRQDVEKIFSFSGHAFTAKLPLRLMYAYTYPFLLMYYNLGFYAEVLHVGYDELVSRNYSFYNLEILINTCFKTAEYKPVKKLISILNKTLFYRKTASQYTMEVKQASEAPLLTKSSQNFRVDAYIPDDAIIERAKRSDSIEKNVAFFQKYINLRNFLTKHNEPYETATFDTKEEYGHFMRAYNSYLAGRATKEELKAKFGKTYFYYYYFE